MNCIFCNIIKGEIPSFTIYEDEIVKVFLDIDPKENGHTLIIPKEHIQDLDDISLATLEHIHKIAKQIKGLLEKKLNIAGITLIQNNGLSQEVKHYHLHLIPNYKEKQPIQKVEDIYQRIIS